MGSQYLNPSFLRGFQWVPSAILKKSVGSMEPTEPTLTTPLHEKTDMLNEIVIIYVTAKCQAENGIYQILYTCVPASRQWKIIRSTSF